MYTIYFLYGVSSVVRYITVNGQTEKTKSTIFLELMYALFQRFYYFRTYYIIGIKQGFSYINIRQVSREVLKTEARDLLMHLVSRFNRCLANAISTDYANLWPRYDHIESCVAVH